MKTVIGLILIAAAVCAADQAAAERIALTDAEIGQLLVHIEEKWGDIQSLNFTFEQKKHLSMFDDVMTSQGQCLFVYPNLFRFEVTQPFQSVMVINKKECSRFEMTEDKWRALKVQKSQMPRLVVEQMADWLQGRFDTEQKLYRISAFVDGQTVVVLTPLNEQFREMIEQIEITLNEKKTGVTGITIREPNNDFTYIRIVCEQRNIELPEDITEQSGDPAFELPTIACEDSEMTETHCPCDGP